MITYQIRSETDTREEVRRIILEQIRNSTEILGDTEMDIDKRIHESRKCFKRIRAVLRLIRDSIGYSHYYRENVFFRDLGATLSPARDASVVFERGDFLKQIFPDLIENKSFMDFQSKLVNDKRELTAKGLNSKILFGISGELNSSIPRFNDLPVQNKGFRIVNGGLKRMYRQGRKYLKKVRRNKDDEIIHNLRKRTKYLWYHMQLLQPVYPKLIGAYENTLDKISEDLGLYRDIILFLEKLRGDSFYINQKEKSGDIEDYYTQLAQEHLNTALTEAEKFYMEKPRIFVKRIKKYWELSLVLKVNQVL